MDNRRGFFGKLAALAVASKATPDPEPKHVEYALGFTVGGAYTDSLSVSKYDPEVFYWNGGKIGKKIQYINDL